jgi:hypothetical protein
MRRVLEPELLDALAPGDPGAVGSRRDLVRINRIMRHPVLMARTLARFPRPKTLLDLGGGDGRFLLAVARRLPWRGVHAVIADRQNIVSDETCRDFAALGWRCDVLQGDVLDAAAAMQTGTLVCANLFLHHLDEAALMRLFACLAGRALGFVACEPRRDIPSLAASHLVFALGANPVSRHDAVASVRAGFSRQELSLLWPPGWQLAERRSFPFTHFFLASPNGL